MKNILIIIFLFSVIFSMAQENITVQERQLNYLEPKEYEIGGVTISGVQYLDQNVLLYITGLEVGKTITIPGEEITNAIKKLWEQELFSDIKITLSRVVQGKAFINIHLEERPRLSKFSFSGIKKKEADDIRDLIKLTKGTQVTNNLVMNSKKYINNYFIDKGYRNVEVEIIEEEDTLLTNSVTLVFKINKNPRIKINEIVITGNEATAEKKWYNVFQSEQAMSDKKIRRQMKNTKQKTWYNIFKSSKLIPEEFEKDKIAVIEKYNELGFRDAKITRDTITKFDEKTVNLYLDIEEGRRYYFRNITWLGNTKYSSEFLTQVLGIKSGDLYNQKHLEEKLFYDPIGVMSLYQDDGYLFSNIMPVEIMIENDSIDLEMRIYEGKQAVINRISIIGNTRTNDHVILREIRSKPGNLYKRSDVQRTIRELAQLGYFNAEKLNVDFDPDPAEGTVDLEYIVEEQPSDQIELSGGWGAGVIVGSLGLTFNNFSLRNIFNFKAYRPLPAGDGQRLSIRAQAGGSNYGYRNFSFSFVEPWFGGRKPNSFAVSAFHSIESNNAKSEESKIHLKISGAALGLGQRLKVPDDYFTLYNELSYKHYDIQNYSYFIYKTGRSNNFSIKSTLGRHSSGPNPIYPTIGSSFSVSVELTPPYSLFNGKDYNSADMTQYERYKWIEYHKYRVTGQWFTTLAGSRDGSSRALVLMTKFDFGLLGMYNRKVGPSPFEGFQMGGDGMYNMGIYGIETIALRGYEHNSLTPEAGGNIFNKYTVELRYPLTLNPTATFYLVAFAEAGNAWYSTKTYNPFDVKRAAGAGIRVYMPMIGMLGIDWGYGFDSTGQKSQIHFVLGQQF
ncbi:outer membrane protein assembly factor BamA [Bacteroidales bacterium OttesenSCG-928-I21]|nr:outer membrane protein assembly factor BamA [Bacteroidales bacterium OttesenSCG-928-I21]